MSWKTKQQERTLREARSRSQLRRLTYQFNKKRKLNEELALEAELEAEERKKDFNDTRRIERED